MRKYHYILFVKEEGIKDWKEVDNFCYLVDAINVFREIKEENDPEIYLEKRIYRIVKYKFDKICKEFKL